MDAATTDAGPGTTPPVTPPGRPGPRLPRGPGGRDAAGAVGGPDTGPAIGEAGDLDGWSATDEGGDPELRTDSRTPAGRRAVQVDPADRASGLLPAGTLRSPTALGATRRATRTAGTLCRGNGTATCASPSPDTAVTAGHPTPLGFGALRRRLSGPSPSR
ncbi:hypothetical protein Van01_14670 [Micromonospora andamanensis]|uniref:Uncharacterized protein n=1 Tax=Micromonospora andamanensis TaxID=1287068 RepID=A0ABQ4HRJ0_9ACTN|nr:hypothetical protein Van01_14670 [Micromonospora andamanensis]